MRRLVVRPDGPEQPLRTRTPETTEAPSTAADYSGPVGRRDTLLANDPEVKHTRGDPAGCKLCPVITEGRIRTLSIRNSAWNHRHEQRDPVSLLYLNTRSRDRHRRVPALLGIEYLEKLLEIATPLGILHEVS